MASEVRMAVMGRHVTENDLRTNWFNAIVQLLLMTSVHFCVLFMSVKCFKK